MNIESKRGSTCLKLEFLLRRLWVFGVGIIILSGVTSYLYIFTDILDVYF